MLDKVNLVAFPFEFRRNHLVSINRGDTECHEHRRNIDVLESTAHRILSTD